MSKTPLPSGISPGTRAVISAAEELTMQVRRIANALSTPSAIIRDGVLTPLNTATTTPTMGLRCVCGDPIEWWAGPSESAGWIHSPNPSKPILDVHRPRPAETCEHLGPHPGFSCAEVDATQPYFRVRWEQEQQARATHDDVTCSRMETRTCPPSYGRPCGERPCARFESDDPGPWLATAETSATDEGTCLGDGPEQPAITRIWTWHGRPDQLHHLADVPHTWDGTHLVLLHPHDDAHPQPGWTLVHWTDGMVTAASPRTADRTYGPHGLHGRLQQAEAALTRLRDADQAALRERVDRLTALLTAILDNDSDLLPAHRVTQIEAHLSPDLAAGAHQQPDAEARPRCPLCQMPHDLTPGSMGARACQWIRQRIDEAGRLHGEGDHSLCCRADCDVLRQRDATLDESRQAPAEVVHPEPNPQASEPHTVDEQADHTGAYVQPGSEVQL